MALNLLENHLDISLLYLGKILKFCYDDVKILLRKTKLFNS